MNIKLSARALTLFAILLIGGFHGSASAATAVSACGTLSPAGNYFLTSNLTATGTCIVIGASNIALDMKGKTITGNGSGSGITDSGSNRDSVVIVNGKIRNFSTGINLSNSGHALISSLDSSKNTGDGIFISGCCNTLNSVTADSNGGTGIFIDSDDSSLTKIQANGNSSDGIFISNCCNLLVAISASNNSVRGVLLNSDDNFMVSGKIQKNSGNGVEMRSCCNGVIKSNTSNNGGDGMDFPSGTVNMVTASKSSGNGGAGVDMAGERFDMLSGVNASKNAATGVIMDCRGSTASLTAKNNSPANLTQTVSDGPCANADLKD